MLNNPPTACAVAGIGRWQEQTLPQANNWNSVIYANNQFVAVAGSGTNRVMTSPDGITWTLRNAAQANTWTSIAYGAGLYVAVAADGTNRVMTSPDGITWTVRTAARANAWQSVIFAGGQFVAVANAPSDRLVMTSPDGITWTQRAAAPLRGEFMSVAYGNSTYAAVGYGAIGNGGLGSDSSMMSSTNGTSWTARSAAQDNSWESVAYGNGLFVAVSSDGTNRVMTSSNGTTWTVQTAVGTNAWKSVIFGNGIFLAATADGITMTSPDGIMWKASGTSGGGALAYGNGVFVAISSGGLTTAAGCNEDSLCGVGAQYIGGYCWYLGSGSQSCDTVCSSRGGCNIDGTRDFAGSGGTLENCQEIANSFGYGSITAANAPGGAVGCISYLNTSNFTTYVQRYTGTTTCSQASQSGTHTRFCACNS